MIPGFILPTDLSPHIKKKAVIKCDQLGPNTFEYVHEDDIPVNSGGHLNKRVRETDGRPTRALRSLWKINLNNI